MGPADADAFAAVAAAVNPAAYTEPNSHTVRSKCHMEASLTHRPDFRAICRGPAVAPPLPRRMKSNNKITIKARERQEEQFNGV